MSLARSSSMHRMSIRLSIVCLGVLGMLAWAQEPAA